MLRAVGADVVLAQPRGRDFVDACVLTNGVYEVDTLLADGTTRIETFELQGATLTRVS